MAQKFFLQAIMTKYFGPTNHHGARVKATAQAGSVTVPWDHALDVGENHEAAARALANKFGWLDKDRSHNRLEGGALPDPHGYAFVFTNDSYGALKDLTAVVIGHKGRERIHGNPYCNPAVKRAVKIIEREENKDYMDVV